MSFGEVLIISCLVSLQRQVSLTGDNCLLCSYLQVQEKGKSWTKTWVAVCKTEPMVLYLQSNGQVRVNPNAPWGCLLVCHMWAHRGLFMQEVVYEGMLQSARCVLYCPTCMSPV